MEKIHEFRFDAALSFAGQDRPRAEAVARAMQSLGLRVFYDKDHHAHLWGKRRSEYEKIYGPDSAFVVPMISKHYSEREWTQWEFETAKREAKKRKGDFLLPIRIDDSRQFGLTDDHNYLGADDFTPDEIARALKAKLATEYGRVKRRNRTHRANVPVLTRSTREALGLIVAGPIPMTIRHFQSLFPDVDWPKHIRQLKQFKMIGEKSLIDYAKHVAESFADELPELQARWVIRLEELQDHVDCALFLSLAYIKQGRLDDALQLVVNVSLAIDSDRWLPLCTTILRVFNDNDKVVQNLPSETRTEFFRAFGHCLSASRQFEAAHVQFEKLRTIASDRKDWESVGLAMLNIGTNYHKQGDIENARRYYQLAREHAAKEKLAILESHALGNLGQIEVEGDPQKAIALLRESLKLKRKTKDEVGVAGSTQVLAVALAELGDFDSAIRHYDEAEALASDLQLLHLKALLFHNKGNTLFEAGKRTEALRSFKKARTLAKNEGFDELLVRATEGVSRVLYSTGKLQKAESYLEEVLGLAKETQQFEFVMTAHHGLWIAKTRLGDHDGGSQHLQALMRVARKKNATHWLVRALVDQSRSFENGDFGSVDSNRLKQLIQKEARRNNREATATLWVEFAPICAMNDVAGAIDGLHRCIACCEGDQKLIEQLFDAHEILYTLHWDFSGQFDRAIETLDAIIGAAKRHGNVEKELAAIDQKGVCLQNLNRQSEALQLHKHVSKVARKQKLTWLEINSLHNLAECHRRLGETNAALRVFGVARTSAVDSGDDASTIQIDHGRALTLEKMQQFDEASKLLQECRDRSRRMEWWPEYVRACEAIANLAWTRGRKKTAVKLYEKALTECGTLDVVEAKPRIAFNLSRLLSLLGDSRRAHKILADHIGLVDDKLMQSDFHSTLASLCEHINRLDDAREHWLIAIKSAEIVGDDDEIAHCRSNYAEFESRHGDPKRTVRELDELLKAKLSEEDRGMVLMQLFKALLQRKLERRAEVVFHDAERHLQKHKQTERLIDLYMTAFDHNWIGNRDSRFTALQAYVAAFAAALADKRCEAHLGKVMGHVMLKLTRPDTAPSLRQLEWLCGRIEEWIVDQIGGAKFKSMFLTPLRYAEKLIPFMRDPVRFLEEHQRLLAGFADD